MSPKNEICLIVVGIVLLGVSFLMFSSISNNTEQEVVSYIEEHNCEEVGIAHDLTKAGTVVRSIYECDNDRMVIR